jgi:nicotinic acid mononucleotide adenylyltransferase
VVWPRPVDTDHVAVLLGAFDPITNAHLAIAEGVRRRLSLRPAVCITKVMLARADDELFSPEQRVPILDAVARRNDIGLAFANRGTYLDVGRALRSSGTDATFIVGSDKIAQLEDPAFYPDGLTGVRATFAELRFIVVHRPGSPIERDDVIVLDPADLFDDATMASISATQVRARVRKGISVEHLVPAEVAVALGGYTSAR